MPAFTTPGPIAATVQVGVAQVWITASDRTETVVLVEPIDANNATDVKAAEKTKVVFADGKLSVKTKAAGRKSGWVAISIDLPAGSSLAADLAHSTIEVDGPVGQCELQMGSGRVQLDRIEALEASIASGEVVVGHIAGRADVDGAAFALRIAEVNGPVSLSNSGGQVWIGHAVADIDLGSAACDFDVDRADGNVSVRTASGAVRIGRLTNGTTKLMNGSGNIEVGISPGVAASIDANSERGAVHNFVTSSGDEPDGKVMVHARTRNGDIIVQRAAN
ncbi:DUF4097 family beta strand repeat-containing protein [Kribbella sp. NPDC051952]|uniref:DUF4097 family beta strand repeat-containing protein n=1 Tax=Kribbella sp. NPDC051952 TaxID=3154851 RepID=UPI003440839D